MTDRGWSDDITGRSGKLEHYYVDGLSLCAKWRLRHYMKLKDVDKIGTKSCMQCMICEKRRRKLFDKVVKS